MFSLQSIIRNAARSNHPFAWHVTFLTRGGAIVAIGYNHSDIHSEAHALSQLWPDHKFGLVCWNFRVTSTGRLTMAKPCTACQELLRLAKIKSIRYSNSEGKMERLKL